MTDVRAVPTVQIDEAAVRVSEWRLAPGAVIDWHRHEYPYVVVPMTTGRLASKGRDGEITTELVAGRGYCRPGGVEQEGRTPKTWCLTFRERQVMPVLRQEKRV